MALLSGVGHRDNITRWTPNLRQAWGDLLAYRVAAMTRNRIPEQLCPECRQLVVTESGHPLTKSGFDTAWQRLMQLAIKECVVGDEQRFTLHGIKHRGITDSKDKSRAGIVAKQCVSATTTKYKSWNLRKPQIFQEYFQEGKKKALRQRPKRLILKLVAGGP